MSKRPKRNAKKSDKKKPVKSKGKKSAKKKIKRPAAKVRKKATAKANPKRNKKRVESSKRLGQKKVKKIVRRPSKSPRKKSAKRTSKRVRKIVRRRKRIIQKHYPITWKKIQDKDLSDGDYKVLEIDLSQIPEPHEKLEAIRTAKIISELTYLYNRDKRENGSIRYPRNVLVFAEIAFPTTGNSAGETGTRWICISTIDRSFVPTPGNVRRLIHQSVQEYYDQMKEKIEVDYNEKTEVYEILKVSVRFLYQTGENRNL